MTLRTHYPYRNVDEALRELVREEEREQEALRRFRERERAAGRKQDRLFVLAVVVTSLVVGAILFLARAL